MSCLPKPMHEGQIIEWIRTSMRKTRGVIFDWPLSTPNLDDVTHLEHRQFYMAKKICGQLQWVELYQHEIELLREQGRMIG